ncbi:ImpA family metalloprotease [Variovorax atrisoli]|uniref:ImpA family metalloprotease n=1 Tax=Variovorax atrisoli TaxID=3394203 RepID=UPI003392B5CF
MPIKFSRYLVVTCLAGLITACGGAGGSGTGGGGGSGGAGTGSVSNPVATAPTSEAPFCSEAVDLALQTGDPSGLTDAGAIATCANDFAKALSTRQAVLPKALYDGQSSEYKPGGASQFVLPVVPESAQPLVVGDKGNVLASLSVAANGRSVGYGANILRQFGDSVNLAHAPVFRRVLGWLLTGDATKPLPSSFRLSYSGIDATTVKTGFQAAGVDVTATACDFSVAGNCDDGSQLLLLGSDVKANPALESQVAQVLASGRPVLYVHTRGWDGWSRSDASHKMLAGMGLMPGPYGGNFFDNDSVAPGRSAAANDAALNQFAGVLPLLRRMAEGDWRTNYDWSACKDNDCSKVVGLAKEVLGPAAIFRKQIDVFSLAGRNLFEQPATNLPRLLVLWGDVIRREISYPMTKTGQTEAFLRATVADSLVAYVRHKGGAQPDLGTFMNGAAANFSVTSIDEMLTIPLTQASGFTALGRFAVPGKTLAIEVVDAAGATVSLQVNSQDPDSTRLWSYRYDRPRFVRSPDILLDSRAVKEITSPYGGPLQLVFAGAPSGAKVRLRIRGVAKHPFFDFSNGDDAADFAAKLKTTAFDWAEIKLPGIEVHTRVDMLKKALNDDGYGSDIDRYLKEMRTYVIEDAYQLAGFAVEGKTLPAAILANCEARGWDCTSNRLHRAPDVQHFNVDSYARCGAGCAGNPIDISWGFIPRGWGESHELGHGLQRNILNVHAGRSGEVSNNLFSLHKNWRLLRELGVDLERDRVAYRSAFDLIVAARSESDPILGAYHRIWGQDDYADQNGTRMAFYMQWIHYWEERTGDKTRGWEILTQLYLHQRLLANANWATDRAKLGYGTYTSLPSDLTGNDNLLIALSLITERDQRATFDLWGVTYSAKAAAQVSSYSFAKEAPLFYANARYNTNNHDTTVRVDMTVPMPVWPL